jgi:hypothetical protein
MQIIPASFEQVKKFYDKHIASYGITLPHQKPKWLDEVTYTYDDTYKTHAVVCKTLSEWKIRVCLSTNNDITTFTFMQFTDNLIYKVDIDILMHIPQLYEILKDVAIEAKENFWAGGDI